MRNFRKIVSIVLSFCTLISGSIQVAYADDQRNIVKGDYISFGTYNGEQLIWRYVSDDDTGALLVLDKTIKNKSFTGAKNAVQFENAEDIAEYDDVDLREMYGSNRWSTSALQTWLNSEDDLVTWCNNTPDNLSCLGETGYDSEAGFLSSAHFTDEEKYAILTVENKNILSQNDEAEATGGTEGFNFSYNIGIDECNFDDAYYDNTSDKMFCLSISQYETIKKEYPETVLPADEDSVYWLRTPKYDKSYCTHYVTNWGVAIDTVASNSRIGVKPAFYINKEVLTIKNGDGSHNLPYTITGSKPINIEKIRLENDNITIAQGKTEKINVFIEPENASNKTLVWESDNEKIATVTNDGTVKAIGKGVAKITVSSADGTISACCNVEVIERQAVFFADDNFKKAVIENCLNNDRTVADLIYTDELENIKSLNISNSNISDLTGLENFIRLETINISGNRLKTFDAKNNIALKSIDCTNSQILNIDVSCCPDLEYLYCGKNSISELNIRNNKNLKWLDCSDNNLTEIDLKENSNLEYLYVSENAFEKIDISKCKLLKSFECQSNRISYLDVSDNTVLTNINCSANKLENLNIENLSLLKQLLIKENRLTKLDISKNSKLTYIDISRNYFTSQNDLTGNNGKITLVYYPQYIVLIPVESISVSNKEIELASGGTFQLSCEITPQGATNKSVRWTSSDTSVANVSESGRVTAYMPGECTVSVISDDGGYTDSCLVRVLDNIAPSVPTSVKEICVTGTSAEFSWNASSDNIAIDKYDIYRNGVYLTSTSELKYRDNHLAVGETYRYEICAKDPSGNCSDKSTALTVTPKMPKIENISPSSGTTIGGTGTQRITVNAANSGNFSGSVVKLYLKNDESWEEPPFDYTVTTAQKSGYNVFYIDFDKTNIESGEYNFKIQLFDRDNNEGYTEAVYYIDRTQPQIIDDIVAGSGQEAVAISWSVARDADVVKYILYRAGTINGTYQEYATINGRNKTVYSDTKVFVNEVYYYKIAAVDEFGQIGELSAPVWASPTKDDTIPVVSKMLPQSNTSINGTAKITVTSTDNIAVARISLQYKTVEDNWCTYQTVTTNSSATFNFDTARFKDGAIELRAIAYDLAGNESNGRPVYTYIVDNTGPSKVTNIRQISSTATTVTLAWDDIPDGDFGYFAVEQKKENGYERIATTSTTLGVNIYNLTPQTDYVYRVVAYDTLGNRGMESSEIKVSTYSDTTSPVITAISPKANRYSKSVPMSITASDDYLVNKINLEYSYNLTDWILESVLSAPSSKKTNTFNYNLDLTDKNEGSLFVRPIAFDIAGNKSNDDSKAPFVEYYVDRTAPDVPKNLEIISNNGYIELKWLQGIEDDLAGYIVYRATEQNGEYKIVSSNLKQVNYVDKNVTLGTLYYYKLAVADKAGNISNMTDYVSGQMLEDKEKPIVYSFSPSDGYTINKSTPINILVGDNNKVSKLTIEYKTVESEWTVLEERPLNTSSSVVSISINKDFIHEGILSFRAFAEDESGNIGDYSKEYTYAVDTTAPSVFNVKCEAGEESVTISWESGNESDLSGFYIYRKTENSGYTSVGTVSSKNQTSYSYINYNLNSSTKYMYKVVSADEVGNKFEAESGWVMPLYKEPEPDNMPPSIKYYVPSVLEVDVEEYFDASSSKDNVAIMKYLWDFGDGTTANKAKVAHSYSSAGVYKAKLTVTDTSGNETSENFTVKVEERKKIGSVIVCVKDTYGKPVSGAGVYFDLGTENSYVYGTNSSGQVTITDYAGTYTVGVYADGYLPAKESVTIVRNVYNTVYNIVIEKKEIIIGELTHTRMTLDEIKAAQIKVDDPANQNVYKYEIVLTYGTERYVASGTTNNINDPVKLKVQDTHDNIKREVYVWSVGGGSYGGAGTGGSGTGGIGGNFEVKPKTIIAVIEMPGEASWLKEFFDVHLHIENQADSEFAIDDCTVKLNYPKHGLTLMEGVVDKYSETETVNIGTLWGQSTKDIFWILRGDVAGEYNISADFNGTLRDFNEHISANFKDSEPIKVYGSENLFLDIKAEDSIAPDSDTAVRVGLTNEGPIDVYLPKVELYDFTAIRTFKTKDDLVVKTSTDILAPGESLWVDYTIPRSVNKNLEDNADKEFYLYSGIVNKIGGNVTLKHRFNIVPAYTISADMIFAYTRDDGGVLKPLDIIELKRGLKAEIPDIIIQTMGLNENMEYVPVSRQITVKDEYLEKHKKEVSVSGGSVVTSENGTITLTTDDSGMAALSGYDIPFALITKEPYSITISSPRAVKKRIPVVMHDGFSESVKVDGVVYYNGGKTRSPIVGAEVQIGDKVTYTDKKGEFSFKYIPKGENSISITKAGYEEEKGTVTVTEDKELTFYLNKIQNENEPHITNINFAQFSNKNGNVTVFPEGQVEGNLQFVISKDLKGEQFAGYKYYIEDDSGNVVDSGEFYSDVYSREINDMKVGQKLLFSLVTIDKTGKTKESEFFDTNIIISNTPAFMDDIMLFLNDVSSTGKFKKVSLPKAALPIQIDTDSTVMRERSMFESSWIHASSDDEDENLMQATSLVEGLRLNSKSTTTFPLNAEFNLDGTIKISLGAKVSHMPQNITYYKSTGDYFAYENSDLSIYSSEEESFVGILDVSDLSEEDKETKKKKLDIGGNAQLDFTLKYDADKRDWRGTLGITLTGSIKSDVFYIQVPFLYVAGGYAYVEVGGSAEARWEPLSGYLKELGIESLNITPIPCELKAGIEAKAGAGAYVVGKDVASAGVYAKISSDLFLIPQQKLLFKYEFGWEGKVLIWEPTDDFFKDGIEIRLNDTDTRLKSASLMSLLSAEENEDNKLIMVDIPEESNWCEGEEQLKSNVFDGSKPVLVKMDDNRIMMVFADYDKNRDDDNPVQLFYSIFNGNEWSSPKTVYDDDTVDMYPYIFKDSDGNISITWINFSEPLKNASALTMNEIRNSIYSKTDVAMSKYDIVKDEWTKPTIVNNQPMLKKQIEIATDKENTFCAWIQNAANHEYGSEDTPDSIGYSINNDENGTIDIAGGELESLSVITMDNQYYIAYIRNDNDHKKAFFRKYSGEWSEEQELNSNVYSETAVQLVCVNGELYAYYVNGTKVFRMNLNTQKTEYVTSDESLSRADEFECTNDGNVVWRSMYGGKEKIYIAKISDGKVTTYDASSDGFGSLRYTDAVDMDGYMLLSGINKSIAEDSTTSDLYVHKIMNESNLYVEDVSYEHKLMSGVSSDVNVSVKNNGLCSSAGFNLYISPDTTIENAFDKIFTYENMLDSGRTATVIADCCVPEDYHVPYVYLIVEDSSGKTTYHKEEIINDSVKFADIKKDSNTFGKMKLILDIDNNGYVDYGNLKVVVKDAYDDSILTEQDVGSVSSGTNKIVEINLNLENEEQLCNVEIVSGMGEIKDSRLVDISYIDYSILLGDYLNDGIINPLDVTAILQKIAFDKKTTEREMLAGDANENGKIEPNDAVGILRYCAGLINNFR